MKIAITRLSGKEEGDRVRCAKFGHECFSVHPLRSEICGDVVDAFIAAVDRNAFDCLFFTSALPAGIIAPRLSRFPRVIAIGPTTASVLRRYDIECETLTSYYSRDFVPYLGDWISGKHIGLPRADVPNPRLLKAIRAAGGKATEFRCYRLVPTGIPLNLDGAGGILFTSAMSFEKAVWTPHPGLMVMAIGEVTADKIRTGGIVPRIVGDGSLEGTLAVLNRYLEQGGSRDPGGGL